MKKSFFIFLCAAILTGCSQNKKEDNNQSATASITIKKGNSQTNIDRYAKYDINGQKIIKFTDDENATTKEIGANVFIRKPLQNINVALIKNSLSKNFIQKCSACHNDYANGIIGPSLLNKSKDEIYSMIKAYKTKTKINPLMADLVKHMSEDEIMELAREINEFNTQLRR